MLNATTCCSDSTRSMPTSGSWSSKSRSRESKSRTATTGPISSCSRSITGGARSLHRSRWTSPRAASPDGRRRPSVAVTTSSSSPEGRGVYDGYIVEDIYCEEGNEYISFTSKPDLVRLGEAVGQVDEDEHKRLQIRKTIEEHLDKELQLRPTGIKVLSLFFIDRVANYRDYDEEGNPRPGKYAAMFEKEYARAIRKPKVRQAVRRRRPRHRRRRSARRLLRHRQAQGRQRVRTPQGLAGRGNDAGR